MYVEGREEGLGPLLIGTGTRRSFRSWLNKSRENILPEGYVNTNIFIQVTDSIYCLFICFLLFVSLCDHRTFPFNNRWVYLYENFTDSKEFTVTRNDVKRVIN